MSTIIPIIFFFKQHHAKLFAKIFLKQNYVPRLQFSVVKKRAAAHDVNEHMHHWSKLCLIVIKIALCISDIQLTSL